MGGGASGTEIPSLLRPYFAELFTEQGPLLQDIRMGREGLPNPFQNLGGLLEQARPAADILGQQGGWGGVQGAMNNAFLAGQLGMPIAQQAAGLSGQSENALAATFPFYNQLLSSVRQQGIGQIGDQALGQIANTGPRGDIYERAAALLRPQVRAGFSARGLGSSGAAIREEGNQMQQLADSFAQRAMQERIGLLGAAAQGQGAESSMMGQRISGSLGGAQLPGQIMNQFQQQYGGALGNLAASAGLNLTPMQASLAGTQALGAGLGLPFQLAQQAYLATRSPMQMAGSSLGVPLRGSSGKK